jgi:hypothetical protein
VRPQRRRQPAARRRPPGATQRPAAQRLGTRQPVRGSSRVPAHPYLPSSPPVPNPPPCAWPHRCDCPRHRAGEQCERELDVEEVCRKHAIRREDCRADNPKLCVNGCNGRGACIGGFCHCSPGGWRGTARALPAGRAQGRGAQAQQGVCARA